MLREAGEITGLPLVSQGGVAGLLMTSLSLPLVSPPPPNCRLLAWVFAGAFAIGSRSSGCRAQAEAKAIQTCRARFFAFPPRLLEFAVLLCGRKIVARAHLGCSNLSMLLLRTKGQAHTATNATFVSSRLPSGRFMSFHRGRCSVKPAGWRWRELRLLCRLYCVTVHQQVFRGLAARFSKPAMNSRCGTVALRSKFAATFLALLLFFCHTRHVCLCYVQ
jgi:hypothetical protein